MRTPYLGARVPLDVLLKYARIRRVERVMRPYLEMTR